MVSYVVSAAFETYSTLYTGIQSLSTIDKPVLTSVHKLLPDHLLDCGH